MAKGKPFTAGQSGNPAGRPSGRGLKAEIEAELAEPCAGYISRATLIARKLIDLAEGGDIRAIELLLKRVWPEKIAVAHERLFEIDLIDLSGERQKNAPMAAGIQLADDSPAPPSGGDSNRRRTLAVSEPSTGPGGITFANDASHPIPMVVGLT